MLDLACVPWDLRGKRTHEDVVHEFLHPRGAPLQGPEPRASGRPLNPGNVYAHDVLWWLDQMVRGRHPLVERMTFNWHDHWATSSNKVGDVNLMMRQQRTFRRHALGNFRNAGPRHGARRRAAALARPHGLD